MPELKMPECTEKRLRQIMDLLDSDIFEVLGFTVNLLNHTITDNLANTTRRESYERLIPTLLMHYSQGIRTELKGKLVKFRGLPGGAAYEAAFTERAVKPIVLTFANRPEGLPKAAKLLGGRPLNFGDYSVEVTPLKGIPLSYVLWVDEEFPATASVLYDLSAGGYLPTEDLAVLGELTTSRLLKAWDFLVKDHSDRLHNACG